MLKPSRLPVLLAGRKQTRVDVPRVLRLVDRWMREWRRRTNGAHADGSKVFYLWVHRGYYEAESMATTAKWAVEAHDKLAALIATLCTGMSATQRSKLVDEFTRRTYEHGDRR